MFNVEVVKCSSLTHKLECLNQAVEAVRVAKFGNATRDGRKVTIRGAITDPCGCHVDALIWLASDIAWIAVDGGVGQASATQTSYARFTNGEMH